MSRLSARWMTLIATLVLAGCRPADQPRPVVPVTAAESSPVGLIPLPEFAGPIRHLLLHAKTGLIAQAAKPIFDLLSAMPDQTRVTILCDGPAACTESRGRMKQY